MALMGTGFMDEEKLTVPEKTFGKLLMCFVKSKTLNPIIFLDEAGEAVKNLDKPNDELSSPLLHFFNSDDDQLPITV
jgi:hypothetical protein